MELMVAAPEETSPVAMCMSREKVESKGTDYEALFSFECVCNKSPKQEIKKKKKKKQAHDPRVYLPSKALPPQNQSDEQRKVIKQEEGRREKAQPGALPASWFRDPRSVLLLFCPSLTSCSVRFQSSCRI
jgi:type IV secretory pathway VirB10-like protein